MRILRASRIPTQEPRIVRRKIKKLPEANRRTRFFERELIEVKYEKLRGDFQEIFPIKRIYSPADFLEGESLILFVRIPIRGVSYVYEKRGVVEELHHCIFCGRLALVFKNEEGFFVEEHAKISSYRYASIERAFRKKSIYNNFK